jgi:hypothetical protein
VLVQLFPEPLAVSLGLNENGKRLLSPTGGTPKRSKHSTPSRTDHSQPFAPSSLGSSLPVTGSPLNPHRNTKTQINIDDDDDDDDQGGADEEEEEEEDADNDDEEEEDDENDDDEEEEAEEEEEEEDSLALDNKASSVQARRAAGSTLGSIEDEDDDDGSAGSEQSNSDAGSDSVSLLSASLPKPKRGAQTAKAGAIERSKGSDGEYIDVESASAHSEVDDDF